MQINIFFEKMSPAQVNIHFVLLFEMYKTILLKVSNLPILATAGLFVAHVAETRLAHDVDFSTMRLLAIVLVWSVLTKRRFTIPDWLPKLNKYANQIDIE